MIDFKTLPTKSKIKCFIYLIIALFLPKFLNAWGWNETQTSFISFIIYCVVGVPLLLKEAFKGRIQPQHQPTVVPNNQVQVQQKQPRPIPFND